MVRSGSELTRIREVHVLCDQESRPFLRRVPNHYIRAARKALLMHGIYVVAERHHSGCEPKRKIFVQLDFHRMCGTSGTGRSSSAEAAANAMAA
jgi:hypothetical protein